MILCVCEDDFSIHSYVECLHKPINYCSRGEVKKRLLYNSKGKKY